MIEVCKCCGHPLPDSDIAAALTQGQRFIYEAIRRAGRAGISTRVIFERMYAADPNGGPDSTNIIAVQAQHANKRLIKFGLKLKGRSGPGGVYTLEKIDVV